VLEQETTFAVTVTVPPKGTVAGQIDQGRHKPPDRLQQEEELPLKFESPL